MSIHGMKKTISIAYDVKVIKRCVNESNTTELMLKPNHARTERPQ